MGSNSSSSPASGSASADTGGSKSEMRRSDLGGAESPDSRLKSSIAEAAEVGAEDTDDVPLLPAGGTEGQDINEQPRRESSEVRGSLADSSTEPPKGSDRESRSGSRADVSGDFKPSISFTGVSVRSSVLKGSGTTKREAPESPSFSTFGVALSLAETCKPGMSSSDLVSVSAEGFLSFVPCSFDMLEKLSLSNGFQVGWTESEVPWGAGASVLASPVG